MEDLSFYQLDGTFIGNYDDDDHTNYTDDYDVNDVNVDSNCESDSVTKELVDQQQQQQQEIEIEATSTSNTRNTKRNFENNNNKNNEEDLLVVVSPPKKKQRRQTNSMKSSLLTMPLLPQPDDSIMQTPQEETQCLPLVVA